MKRTVLKATGESIEQEVGEGFETWNRAIGADIGTLVISPDGTVELWCDDNGLCVARPILNRAASILAGQQIVGDVIVFYPGDVK